MTEVVRDAGDLRRYRVEIPNLLDDWDLSVYAFRLYVHYKRRAGAQAGGYCQEGFRDTAATCRMSAGAVSKAREELSGAGLIVVERTDPVLNRPDRVTIVDVWDENFARYSRQTAADPVHVVNTPVHVVNTPVHVVNTPVHVVNTPVHVVNTPVHVVNTLKKEPLEKEQEREVERRASSEPESASLETSKPVQSPRSSRLPDDWQPTRDLLTWARREFPGVDPAGQVEPFRDYWHANGTAQARKLDWSAAFRTWIRRAAEFSASDRSRGSPIAPSQRQERPTFEQAVASTAATYDRIARDGDGL